MTRSEDKCVAGGNTEDRTAQECTFKRGVCNKHKVRGEKSMDCQEVWVWLEYETDSQIHLSGGLSDVSLTLAMGTSLSQSPVDNNSEQGGSEVLAVGSDIAKLSSS